MGKQSEVFLASEGIAWVERNKNKDRSDDQVLALIERANLRPIEVMEVGCGDGWRLDLLASKYGCETYGIDPSIGEDATDIELYQSGFDLVIMGFCMYLIDREDIFKVVYEVDRVLKIGGHLIIHDFYDGIYARPYEHREGIMSYHMPYMDLWLANPQYQLVEQISKLDDKGSAVAAVMLKKVSVEEAYPVQP